MTFRLNGLFQHTTFRYSFGIAAVAAALGLRIWFLPWTGTGAPFVLFFAAVVVTSLFAGVGPGILSVVLSMPLAAYIFVIEAGYPTAQASFQSLLFAVDGIVVIYLTLLMNKAVRSLQLANRQVRESEERYRAVSVELRQTLDTAATGLTHCSRDLRYLSANPAYAQYIGLSLAQIVGRPIVDVMGEAAFEIIRPRVERVLSGERVEYEDALPLGGGLKYVHVVYTPDRDAAGTVVGWVASVMDISERKRIEREQEFLAEVGVTLSKSLDYEQTLANVPRLVVQYFADWCAVDVMDEHGHLSRLKVACADHDKAELCGVLEQMPPDRDLPHLMRSVFDGKRPIVVEEVTTSYIHSLAQSLEHQQALLAAGITSFVAVPLLLRGEALGALFLGSSTPSRAIGRGDLRLAEALADRAAIAIENAQLYRSAVYATQLRDQVLGVVAHDLRNPLSAILVQTSALWRRGAEPERRSPKPLEVIHRAANRMNRLIQDLMDVALMEAGQLTIKRARLPPGDLIAEVVEMQRPLAASSSLELGVDVGADVADVSGDWDRLLQVFENLIGNAVKFTQAGGRITVGAASRDEEVVFRVADTGCGMPAEHLPHVFDRFWQATRSGRQGAGLGLPITRGIVEAHGGRIWVESTVGRGSTFFFTIPKAISAAEGLTGRRRPGRAA